MFPICFRWDAIWQTHFDREIQHQIASLNLPTWISDVCCNKNPAPFFLKVIWQHCWLFLSQLSHLICWALSFERNKKASLLGEFQYGLMNENEWYYLWVPPCSRHLQHELPVVDPGVKSDSGPQKESILSLTLELKVEKSLDHHRLVSWTDKDASENIFGFTMVSLNTWAPGTTSAPPQRSRQIPTDSPREVPFPQQAGKPSSIRRRRGWYPCNLPHLDRW